MLLPTWRNLAESRANFFGEKKLPEVPGGDQLADKEPGERMATVYTTGAKTVIWIQL